MARIFVVGSCVSEALAQEHAVFLRGNLGAIVLEDAERYRVVSCGSSHTGLFWLLVSDEPYGGEFTCKRGRVVWAGYTHAPDEQMRAIFDRNVFASAGRLCLEEALGGIAAFCLLDEPQGVAHAWSTQPPVEPLFYCRTAYAVVLSNRPAAAQMATLRRTRPVLSRDYLQWYLPYGYALDRTTPFDGVQSLLPGEMISIGGGRVWHNPHPNPPLRARRMDPIEETVKRGAASLSRAVEPLSRHSAVELYLSGGKDSRLLLAALSSQGISFDATTMLLSDPAHMEVIRHLVQQAGIKHSSLPTNYDEERIGFFLRRFIRMSGGLPGPESQGDILEWPTAMQASHPMVIGHAHLQKGGYLRRNIRALDEARAELTTKFQSEFTRNEVAARAVDYVMDWARTAAFEKPSEALYWANHNYRVSKYLVPFFTRASHDNRQMYPLVDESFARFCGTANLEQMASESLHFLLTRHFDERMADTPLPRARWRFERGGPSEIPGFEKRAPHEPPMPRLPRQASARTPSDAMKAHIRDLVLSSSIASDIRALHSDVFWRGLSNWKPGATWPCEASNPTLAAFQAWRCLEAVVLYDEAFS